MSSNIEHSDIRFKELINRLLLLSNIKEKYIAILLSDTNMLLFSQSFTSKSAYPDRPEYNYEVFEQLGDLIANKFIVNYMYKRFPQLDCPTCVKIVARLKINYGARQSFYEIANSLGFWNFIIADEKEKREKRKKLLEDVFESFFGVIEKILDDTFTVGVGYAICYAILENIFNSMPISLKYEDLYDSKTILKQLFDTSEFKNSFKIRYDSVKNPTGHYTVSIYKVPVQNDPAYRILQIFSNFIEENNSIETDMNILWESRQRSIYDQINSEIKAKNYNSSRTHMVEIKLGEGHAMLKTDAEQKAAKQALLTLKSQGKVPIIPPEYKTFCRFI